MTEEATAEQAPKEKAETKREYLVTRPNTANTKTGKDAAVLEVGDIVLLTDAQADARVNKVRLRDEVDAAASKAGRKSKIEKEHGELTERVAELEAQNKALHDENVKLKGTQ